MKNNGFDLINATFSYFISSSESKFFRKHLSLSQFNLIISYSDNTNVLVEKREKKELVIIGFCLDSHGEILRENIPTFLLENNTDDIQSILTLAKRLAGKYIIIYINSQSVYMFGDATGSLPINYNSSSHEICVSSYETLVAKSLGYKISDKALDIRINSDFSQPLPYNITLYDEIKCLLPNHYLNLLDNEASRFAPSDGVQNTVDNTEEIIDKTIQLVDNIVKEYSKYYDIVCPLSGGWDSRLILAFLRRNLPEITAFTFNHAGFSEKTGDVYVPREISSKFGFEHILINDLSAPDDCLQRIGNIIGKYFSKATVDMAFTYNSVFGGKAFVNGDIIDQVGKSLIGNALPVSFAKEFFFIAKQHNYSKYIKAETKKYIEEVKNSSLFNEIYDLFAVENRCGRWAAQAQAIYNIFSITSLNIFNCLEIIEYLMQVPRKLRSKKIIHRAIFGKIAPEMLEFIFNPDDKFSWLKGTPTAFLLGTYAKYFLNGIKRCLAPSNSTIDKS